MCHVHIYNVHMYDTFTSYMTLTSGGRFRAGALDKKIFHDCSKCKQGGGSNYGVSTVVVHFNLDGTCRCRWPGGSWTNGRWHARNETSEERAGPCELCEELRDDERAALLVCTAVSERERDRTHQHSPDKAHASPTPHTLRISGR